MESVAEYEIGIFNSRTMEYIDVCLLVEESLAERESIKQVIYKIEITTAAVATTLKKVKTHARGCDLRQDVQP